MQSLREMVGLWIVLTVLVAESKSADGGKYNTIHLDSALHHYETLHVNQIHHPSSSSPLDFHEGKQISFTALEKEFHLLLNPHKGLFSRDFAAYSVDAEGHRKSYTIKQEAFMQGYLKGENESRVVAHLSNEGVLSAVVATPGEVFHVEPSFNYIKEPHPFHMIIYAKSHVKQRLNSSNLDYAVPPKIHTHLTLEKNDLQSNRLDPESWKAHQRLRRQSIIGSMKTSCRVMLVADHTTFMLFTTVESTITQLVTLFSTLDTLIYRPTGWVVDVNDNTVTDFGHEIAQVLVHNGRTFPANVPASELLGLFNLGPWNGYCLAHLFTNRNFRDSGLLGLANIASPRSDQTGGICSTSFRDPNSPTSRTIIYNTGLSTFNNNGLQMVRSEMVRVTGHELGHNWGSHHDPPTDECRRFLMNGFAQDGSEPTHMMFSPCSSRSIGEVLLNKAANCFTPPQTCGDFRVDSGEDCDVGQDQNNPCCRNCRFINNAQCSDLNSLCCHDCAFADSRTTCRRGSTTFSPNCTGNTLCDGMSAECNGEPQPAAVNTLCSGGRCLLNEISEIQCIGICESMNLSSCSCTIDNECMICCQSNGGSCNPLEDVTLSNGVLCSRGICRNGVCNPRTQDSIERIWRIITSQDPNAFRVFLAQNIVGCVLFFTLVAWIPASLVIHILVDSKLLKKYLSSKGEKPDIGEWYQNRIEERKNLSTVHKMLMAHVQGGSDEAPLLNNGREEKDPVYPVEEPEDDLPLPEFQ